MRILDRAKGELTEFDDAIGAALTSIELLRTVENCDLVHHYLLAARPKPPGCGASAAGLSPRSKISLS
jgi:hypothetical protein